MPYDLSEAFEKIEDELTGSLIKNLKRHKAEETELGFRWEQWQALQLKALEDYRRNNLKKFPPRYSKLNNQIRTILQDSYNDGSTKQEKKIMQAIKRGFKGKGTNSPAYTGEAKIEGDFFRTNDRKLDSLVESVTHDMERAEYAVLRRTNDQYRQIIFNAQVYANTGAGTYEKAVDMATRDFLRAGIDSIEYKNGSRHTISDYADMAIKTASKRAYLQGEGAMREEWGIVTVILNKRACPCPLCAPFVGKVFIDDVWSGGQGVAGTDYGISPITGVKYPLLSAAIRQGLYHPRCRDVHTTYFEGVSTPPEDSEYTADELDALAEKYNAEQKQNYCERQEKRYDRISKYSLDEENQRVYGARAKAFGDKAEEFKKLSDSINIPAETVENFGGSGIINAEELSTFKNEMSELGITDLQGFENYQGDPQILHQITEDFGKMKTAFPKLFSKFNKISLSEQNKNEYAFYESKNNYFNFNSLIYNDSELLKTSYQNDVDYNYHPIGTTYRSNVFHEFGHFVETIADINPKKLAKSIFQKQNGKYFTRQMGDDWLHKGLCDYASEFDYQDYISECFAEYFGSKKPRIISVDTVNEIYKMLSKKGMM